MTKKALITGITGQDGAILSRLLLDKGYEVHGMKLYSAVPDEGRLEGLEQVYRHYGDLTDGGNITRLIDKIQPDEVYNLASMSHVHVSFDAPEACADINGLGALRILEAIRNVGGEKNEIKFYQASSSEMFGRSAPPQNEDTKMEPCSPYGVAKLYAYWTTRNYREAYGLYAANGILFNHESPLRGEEFVTRKITRAICEIEAGFRQKLSLGNLDAKRDWGHAQDYMEGIWQILQAPEADDYVLATGESKSVRDFVEAAFQYIGRPIVWEGRGLKEVGRDKVTGDILVDINAKFFRPTEVHYLLGDSAKAREALGWKPKFTFESLVADMMQSDRLVDAQRSIRAV